MRPAPKEQSISNQIRLFMINLAYESQLTFALNQSHQISILAINSIALPITREITKINDFRALCNIKPVWNQGATSLAFPSFASSLSKAKNVFI